MVKTRTTRCAGPRDAARAALERASTHMRTLAREALAEARVDNPDRWIVDAGTGEGAAEWDHDRVLQLLSNLLAHALQYGAENSAVSFAWWGEEDEVVLDVEYDPKNPIRDPSWTLGLSVAREIARAHGGDLTVRDTASGRVFRAVLPRRVRGSGKSPGGALDARPITANEIP